MRIKKSDDGIYVSLDAINNTKKQFYNYQEIALSLKKKNNQTKKKISCSHIRNNVKIGNTTIRIILKQIPVWIL